MIKATFTGRDYSLGFRTGKSYILCTRIHSNLLWIETPNKKMACGYANAEAFLANWKVETE